MTSAQTEKASSRLRRAERPPRLQPPGGRQAHSAGAAVLFVPVLLLHPAHQRKRAPILRSSAAFPLLPGRSLLTNLKAVLANANIPCSPASATACLSRRSLRCSVFIFQRSPPTASMPMTSNSKAGLYVHPAHRGDAHTGIRAGLCSAHHQNGHGRHPRTAVFCPSIAAPVVFYFMLQYMEATCPWRSSRRAH